MCLCHVNNYEFFYVCDNMQIGHRIQFHTQVVLKWMAYYLCVGFGDWHCKQFGTGNP